VLKRRHTYVLLFALPSFLFSAIAAALMLAAAAGALWLFVYGDNPWPDAANTVMSLVFFGVGAALWVTLLSAAYVVGKTQEGRPSMSVAHVALALGTTAVLVGVIVLRLMEPSLTGTPADSVVCAEFCQRAGFAGSGMPSRDSGDRTCTCYDAFGRESRRVDLSAGLPASDR
jgi:hypothetical protein